LVRDGGRTSPDAGDPTVSGQSTADALDEATADAAGADGAGAGQAGQGAAVDPAAAVDRPAAVRQGVSVAREALAAARAEARSRGQGTSGPRRRRGAAPVGQRRSGARPDDRDPQPIGVAIGRLMAERGWEADLAIGGVIGRWDTIVGAEVAAHCRPEGFAEGVVTVRADSTAWATQVRLLTPALIRRLNEELGDATVQRVRVLGPTAPSWIRGTLSVRGRGPRDTYG
jgi:predicted nucleic acid-binding Zn ribbon protein